MRLVIFSMSHMRPQLTAFASSRSDELLTEMFRVCIVPSPRGAGN